MSLIFNLMHSAVDYAGLFPPAGLPMQQVVDNYAKYRESPERSMLGRLIVPANKLSLLENAASDFLPTDAETPPWRISALVPPVALHSNSFSATELESALETIHAFNEKHLTEGDVGAVVDVVEVKAPSIAAVEATLERIPDPITAFLEVPHQSDPAGLFKSISEKGAGKRVFAKIRTGGISADVIPSVAEVARFISSCANYRVGFKATAGLHHPMRAEYRLTYQDDSPKSLMHGFLNVFVAAVIAFEHSASPDTLISILSNQSPADFVFENKKLTWENFEVSAERVLELRNSGIISFGSCSFVEPTMELQRIPGISYISIFSG
jgi:hypothetical protein